jgi:hypothetical protein
MVSALESTNQWELVIGLKHKMPTTAAMVLVSSSLELDVTRDCSTRDVNPNRRSLSAPSVGLPWGLLTELRRSQPGAHAV